MVGFLCLIPGRGFNIIKSHKASRLDSIFILLFCNKFTGDKKIYDFFIIIFLKNNKWEKHVWTVQSVYNTLYSFGLCSKPNLIFTQRQYLTSKYPTVWKLELSKCVKARSELVFLKQEITDSPNTSMTKNLTRITFALKKIFIKLKIYEPGKNKVLGTALQSHIASDSCTL